MQRLQLEMKELRSQVGELSIRLNILRTHTKVTNSIVNDHHVSTNEKHVQLERDLQQYVTGVNSLSYIFLTVGILSGILLFLFFKRSQKRMVHLL